MKASRKHFNPRSRGQAILIVVLALPAIIGCLTLVMDVGNLYYNKVWMQTAMDSGVLAGAMYLPSYPDQAKSTAVQYAIDNGLKSSEIVSVSVTPDMKAVTMSSVRSIPCLFCAVLGESNVYAQSTSTSGTTSSGTGIHAAATAAIQAIRSATGVVPIGVDYRTDLSFGSEVTLKQGQVGPGNWGPLALGSTGASEYQTNIEYGYPGLMTVGDWPQTEPGDVVGPTDAGIGYRISTGQNEYSTGTFQNHALADPRVMVVPLVDFSDINGSSDVPLKGFAVMWIVNVTGNGTITCYFIQQSIPNAIPDPGAASTGATTPVLK